MGCRRVAAAATAFCRRDGARVLDAGRGIDRRPYDCHHYIHDWSQDAALAHTAQQTAMLMGLRWGRTLRHHAFIALWAGRRCARWHDRAAHERRPAGARDALLAIFLFMFVNAGVVFAHGPARVVGTIAVSIVLLARFVFRPAPTRSSAA